MYILMYKTENYFGGKFEDQYFPPEIQSSVESAKLKV